MLTSGNKVFCAGLDITEMYQPSQERLETFWGSLQDLWLASYGCKLPMTAAITGHRFHFMSIYYNCRLICTTFNWLGPITIG